MSTPRAEQPVTGRVPVEALVLRVPNRSEEVAPTRRAVHDYLLTNRVPAPVADDLRLVASELVTNAMLHGHHSGVVDVELALQPPADIELRVTNRGPAGGIPPVDTWHPAPALAPSGRGLGIVRRLCDEVEVLGDRRVATVVCRRTWQSGGPQR